MRPSVDTQHGPMCPVCGGNPGLHTGTQCLREALPEAARSLLNVLTTTSAYVRSESLVAAHVLCAYDLAEETAPGWWRLTSLGRATAAKGWA